MINNKLRNLSLFLISYIGVFGSVSAFSQTIEQVTWEQQESAFTGEYEVLIEHDSNFDTHTIYRPKILGDIKHPIVVWGEGGCIDAGMMFPEFLSELASHGFVIVADGPPISMAEARANRPQSERATAVNTNNPPRPPFIEPDGSDLITALDWITEQNKNSSSRFYQKLNQSKVAAMGMSCGGLMAYGASSDPRITTVGIWNSGLLEPDEEIYKNLHTSIIIVTGDESDVAYPNGKRDFETIDKSLPIFYAYGPGVPHAGTYREDNGGIFGKIGVAWLRWQLLNDETENGKGKFVGDDCGLCEDEKLVVKSRSLE